MNTLSSVGIVLATVLAVAATAEAPFESDSLATSAGELKTTFIGHGSLMFSFAGVTLHVDPYGKLADYAALPKADLILITHEHQDHLDPAALALVRTDATVVIGPAVCAPRVAGLTVTKNGDTRTVRGVGIEAVPAYNLVHQRDTGQPYHPRGNGNGYVLTFGDQRVYVAGDTEDTPEMRALQGIDWAFLPMNLPYTMTPEMVAAAAKAFRPKVLYPYHFGETDVGRLVDLLKDEKGIEVRLRRMK